MSLDIAKNENEAGSRDLPGPDYLIGFHVYLRPKINRNPACLSGYQASGIPKVGVAGLKSIISTFRSGQQQEPPSIKLDFTQSPI